MNPSGPTAMKPSATSVSSVPVSPAASAAAHSERNSSVTFGMLTVRLSRPLAGGFPPEVNHGLSHRHLGLVIDGLRTNARPPAEVGGPALTLADLGQFPQRHEAHG